MHTRAVSWVGVAVVILAALTLPGVALAAQTAKADKPAAGKSFNPDTCYGCHAPIKEFHAGS